MGSQKVSNSPVKFGNLRMSGNLGSVETFCDDRFRVYLKEVNIVYFSKENKIEYPLRACKN